MALHTFFRKFVCIIIKTRIHVMKQLVLSLLCLLAAVSLRAADDVNIVFIGNSITYGATLPDRATQAPPVHVGKAIAQQTGRHVEVRNCGVSGATTTDFLPIADHYWPPVVKAADELSQLKGQLVFTIMLGTNDSAQDGCFGAPDWIVEVVSPSSKSNDYGKKLFKYREAGVKLYWIIDPMREMTLIYDFSGTEAVGETTGLYPFDEELSCALCPDLKIRIRDML